MRDLKQLGDELRSTFERDLKPRIDALETESKKYGSESAETREAIDRVQDALDSIETQLQAASLAPRGDDVKASLATPEGRAFKDYLRKGKKYLEGEGKTLVIRDESQGGVLAPTDYVAELVKGIVQYSPIRDIAKVRPTSRTNITLPKRTGNFAAVWTGESSTRSETTGLTFGLEEIPTHEMYARVGVSNWDLEDPVVDLEAEIREDMSEQFGVLEGAGFVSGTGVNKPEGFLVNADVIANPVLNGAASFTNADGIIKLAFSVKEQYWPNARFVLNRLTLRDLRTLKDSSNNYLWQPTADGVHGLSTGLPATLYGYPYTIAKDVPTAASNALTVAFGDFYKAYTIADRIEIAVLQDPYTAATSGAVIFHARKRVGGQVVLPEAINVLKMA